MSQTDLLTLDGGTSQWASAAALTGDTERLPNAPYKLQVTYDAIEYWNRQDERGAPWRPRSDRTISRQAAAWKAWMNGEVAEYVPEHSEEYPFARTFDRITPAEGLRRWPSLRHHESDRIAATDRALKQYRAGQGVDSDDHRIVQAIALRATIERREVRFTNRESVAKSWPAFWKFLEAHACVT